MAHMIDESNGRSNIAYVGEVPWHGLGQKLTEGAPIEVWCKEAGFDWEIMSSKVLFKTDEWFDGENRTAPVDDRRVLWRSDTKAPLSIVSDRYNVTQPKEIAEFFRDLIAASQFKMETMGMLQGGRRYWALAKADDSFTLAGGDTILPYLLVASSCDGMMSNCADFTSIRVVCNNTLSASIGDRGQRAKIRIPHSRKFDEREVKHELGITEAAWLRFKTAATSMSKAKMNREGLNDFFSMALYGKTMAAANKSRDAEFDDVTNSIAHLRNIYHGGVGQSIESAKGTVWGAVNAVTRYVDHERRAKNNDYRLNYAWFGQGNVIKNRAFEEGMKLAA